MAALGTVVETIRDDQGRVVSTGKPFDYLDGDVPESMPLAFRGVDASNNRLPAGTYRLRFTVRDLARNPGRAKAVTVHVSDQPLVEVTRSVVVAPTAASSPTGRSLSRGGDDPLPIPCGTVVPSDGVRRAGRDELPLVRRLRRHLGPAQPRDSERRHRPVRRSCRPTSRRVACGPHGCRCGEAHGGGRDRHGEGVDVRWCLHQPVRHVRGGHGGDRHHVADRSATRSRRRTSRDYVRRVRWTIETRGTDSFDVAAVTVSFTYLTPQA